MSWHNENLLWAAHEKARELYCMQVSINEGDFEDAMYFQLRFLQAHDELHKLMHNKRGAADGWINFTLDAHGIKHK